MNQEFITLKIGNLKLEIRNFKKGFTLIELIVVISIMAVLGVLGYSAFTTYSARQAVNNAAQDIVLAINRAKFNASSSVVPAGCDILNKYLFQVCSISNSCVGASSYEIDYECANHQTPEVFNSQSNSFVNVAVNSSSTCSVINFFPVTHAVTGTVLPCTIILNGPKSQNATITVDQNANISIQ